MTRDHVALWLAVVLAAFAAGTLLRACIDVGAVRAQDRPMSEADRMTVARALVAEAPPGDDYLAILGVFASRSSSLAWAAEHYCALYVARHPSRRQREVRMLPYGPARVRYRRHWAAAMAAIDAWTAGARPPCAAEHFGDRGADAERARRAGWHEVDCGRTANIFYVR